MKRKPDTVHRTGVDGEGMWKEKLDTAQQTGVDDQGMWRENLTLYNGWGLHIRAKNVSFCA